MKVHLGVRIWHDNVANTVTTHQAVPLTDASTINILKNRLPITQQSKAWHAARDCHITASDVAAVLGQNKYCSRTEVILRKLKQYEKLRRRMDGKPEEKEQDGGGAGMNAYANVACRWGQDHEAEAAALYSYVTGTPLYCDDIGLLIHATNRCVGATPDALARDRPLLIEIKSPYRRRVVPGYVPDYYMPQVQVQMEVCDMDLCHFVQYTPATIATRGSMDIVEVKRDPEWWKSTSPQLVRFWKEVIETATGEDYSDEAIDELTRAIVEKESEPTDSANPPKYAWRWPPDGRYDITATGDSVVLDSTVVGLGI